MSDLFNFASSSVCSSAPYQPLADRMRPTAVEDIFGQEHILGVGKPLRLLIDAGLSSSVIFWGPPGCGKTTLVRVIASRSDAEFVQLSAVNSGVKDLKAAFDRAIELRRSYGRKTILFVDEIHRFNKAQQDSLLMHVESGTVIFVGATTENPSFEVISALLSRCQVLVLKPISVSALIAILVRAIKQDLILSSAPKVSIDEKAIERIALMAAGDARIALNVLETCYEVARQKSPDSPCITIDLVSETFQSKMLRYDKGGEEHYNLISALHKSLRGSDPDASLYWLYRMINGGENCRFILRRLIRFAAEDVGMADPFALTLSMSASQAFEYVGKPEGYLFLAQLTVYLALAPKSNSLYMAEHAVNKAIKDSGEPSVPMHLRNAPTSLMKELGCGIEYKYPHNYKGAFVNENYFPAGLENSSFYKPTGRGKEKLSLERLKQLWPRRLK